MARKFYAIDDINAFDVYEGIVEVDEEYADMIDVYPSFREAKKVYLGRLDSFLKVLIKHRMKIKKLKRDKVEMDIFVGE